MQNLITVNQTEYTLHRLLGHGKGGYSYLAEAHGNLFVVKQIHHEPCDYYSFGNKIESEIRDYRKLLQVGIRMPKMLDVDIENQRIVKEYIDGPTIYDLVKNDTLDNSHLRQIREMAATARSSGLNIDYFPTNFIVQNGVLFYIDYECNPYMAEWSFEQWGIQYWSKTPAFLAYMENH